MLEQAARNAMNEREANGCMIWGVGIDKFVEEYLKLKGKLMPDALDTRRL